MASNSLVMPCGPITLTANFEKAWPWVYDKNDNGKIDYWEMVDALMDYLVGDITYSQMVDVLMEYLTG